jgi:uncharacterized membrane protein (DUF2068 family)
VFTLHRAGAFHPVLIHYGAGGINLLGLLSSVPGFGQKKWVRRRWGEDLIWGFSSPHTLLPKEEKEEKNVTCDRVSAKRVPLNGNDFSFN